MGNAKDVLGRKMDEGNWWLGSSGEAGCMMLTPIDSNLKGTSALESCNFPNINNFVQRSRSDPFIAPIIIFTSLTCYPIPLGILRWYLFFRHAVSHTFLSAIKIANPNICWTPFQLPDAVYSPGTNEYSFNVTWLSNRRKLQL